MHHFYHMIAEHMVKICNKCQCPLGLELLLILLCNIAIIVLFQCPLGLELLLENVITCPECDSFNALTGLSCYDNES